MSCSASPARASVASSVLVAHRWAMAHEVARIVAPIVTWFAGGQRARRLTPSRADPLTAIMLTTVTFIGTLIAIFSIGYMHGDPGYPRFFAECQPVRLLDDACWCWPTTSSCSTPAGKASACAATC